MPIKPAPGSTPDLVATLREIQRIAVTSARSLRDGSATNGASALAKIELAARDAVRHGEAAITHERKDDV